MRPRFHLALPVDDLEAARPFYCDLLGCATGREAERWLDLDFFGHQLTLHLAAAETRPVATNEVDREQVPARHFGVILTPGDWQALADRLRAACTRFLIEPTVRFEGQPGEQRTLFITDPSGNALEFKSFADDAAVFAQRPAEHDAR
ncbi:MAG: VOC family protein [Pseudomonadota bacterium]